MLDYNYRWPARQEPHFESPLRILHPTATPSTPILAITTSIMFSIFQKKTTTTTTEATMASFGEPRAPGMAGVRLAHAEAAGDAARARRLQARATRKCEHEVIQAYVPLARLPRSSH
jgi:hypothetical protein